MSETIKIEDWGLIDYPLAAQRMMDLVDLVHHELARDVFIFCTHPPVVTLGRGTRAGDVFAWQGPTVEVNRGGRATYHGPNQLIVYPIVDLSQRGRDLHLYLRDLEAAIIEVLASYGISAVGHAAQTSDDGESRDATGVWVGSRKIASIGIGVRKWISFHGLALNVDHDPGAFTGLKPCGFQTSTMISMEEILGARIDRRELQSRMAQALNSRFAAERAPAVSSSEPPL